jgi:hypothetical protein
MSDGRAKKPTPTYERKTHEGLSEREHELGNENREGVNGSAVAKLPRDPGLENGAKDPDLRRVAIADLLLPRPVGGDIRAALMSLVCQRCTIRPRPLESGSR